MKRKNQHGLTLIELMIAVAIGIILMTMAVPSFVSTVQNNRLATKANELIADLNLARMEAVKQTRTATLCRSANGTSCAGSGTNWEAGWIVWVDNNGNGSMDAGELVRTHEAVTGATLTGSTHTMTYLSTGFSGSGANVTFTLSAENCTGNQVRTITIIPTGRANVTPSACS